MPYQFPASDLDRPNTLLSVVGSFWSDLYTGSHLVRSFLHARAQLDVQTHSDLLELTASMSRFKTPVFHVDNWHLITLRRSERNQTSLNFAKYDGSHKYDGSIAYDVPLSSAHSYWTAPSELKHASLIFNRITDPSLTLVAGLDFILKDGVLVFFSDPFANELIPQYDVKQGDVYDAAVDLWLYHGEFDRQTMYKQFGYIMGVNKPSSQNYKDFVNALFDGVVEASTRRSLLAALSALTDVPIVKDEGEVVERIVDDARSRWVVTNKNTYAFHKSASVLVAVGDEVHVNSFMTDTIQVMEFNTGEVPTAEQLRALAIGRGFLAEGYFQDLVFENKTTPLIVKTADDDYTRVEFDVQGWPGDVEKFWNDIHAAGVAKNETLAMLLDQRTNKTGQPTAMALPATINPLGFLVQNLFRSNLFIVKLRSASFGPKAIGLSPARLLSKIIPPHTAMILVMELAVSDEPIMMDGPGTTTQPGYSERVTTFTGQQIQTSINPEDFTKEKVRVVRIQGRCE